MKSQNPWKVFKFYLRKLIATNEDSFNKELTK